MVPPGLSLHVVGDVADLLLCSTNRARQPSWPYGLAAMPAHPLSEDKPILPICLGTTAHVPLPLSSFVLLKARHWAGKELGSDGRRPKQRLCSTAYSAYGKDLGVARNGRIYGIPGKIGSTRNHQQTISSYLTTHSDACTVPGRHSVNSETSNYPPRQHGVRRDHQDAAQ